MTITNLVFIGTIGLHEFGHFSVSKVLDCKNTKIIYESDYPYTEALCNSQTDTNILLASAIIIPIILSILLFIIDGIFIRDISYLIMGFNLLASFKDLISLGISQTISIFISFIGIIFVIIGIILLAKSRSNQLYSIFE